MVSPEDWERPQDMCRLLGNSMASNALLRVAVPLIRAIRPELDVQDPWSNGHAQRLLRKSAQATHGTCEGTRDDPHEPKEASNSPAPAAHWNAGVQERETIYHWAQILSMGRL